MHGTNQDGASFTLIRWHIHPSPRCKDDRKVSPSASNPSKDNTNFTSGLFANWTCEINGQ
ncbi:hypothetical protein WG66_002964 [Moniliophthora roreri]|nr:hypothetical protein WG66_002964 [Moniliophthora roreri]